MTRPDEEPAPLPVYLIHHEQPDWCASAVTSVRASRGVIVDLTVINNDPDRRVLLEHIAPDTRVVPLDENRGYTGGANAAIRDWMARYPDGELCVVASHDLHVERDTLRRLADLAFARPDAGILAPALVAPEPAAGGVWTGGAAKQRTPDAATEIVECQWASGTCLMLRRSCVERVGPFDERLGSYCEDVDYGLRATDAGWKVLVLTSAHASGLGSASSRAWGLRAANTVLLNAKRQGVGAAAASFSNYAVSTVRAYIGSAMVWREHDRRERSRAAAHTRATELARLVWTGAVIRMVRHPEDGRW